MDKPKIIAKTKDITDDHLNMDGEAGAFYQYHKDKAEKKGDYKFDDPAFDDQKQLHSKLEDEEPEKTAKPVKPKKQPDKDDRNAPRGMMYRESLNVFEKRKRLR